MRRREWCEACEEKYRTSPELDCEAVVALRKADISVPEVAALLHTTVGDVRRFIRAAKRAAEAQGCPSYKCFFTRKEIEHRTWPDFAVPDWHSIASDAT